MLDISQVNLLVHGIALHTPVGLHLHGVRVNFFELRVLALFNH